MSDQSSNPSSREQPLKGHPLTIGEARMVAQQILVDRVIDREYWSWVIEQLCDRLESIEASANLASRIAALEKWAGEEMGRWPQAAEQPRERADGKPSWREEAEGRSPTREQPFRAGYNDRTVFLPPRRLEVGEENLSFFVWDTETAKDVAAEINRMLDLARKEGAEEKRLGEESLAAQPAWVEFISAEVIAKAMKKAAEEEREACALAAINYDGIYGRVRSSDVELILRNVAESIRTRGEFSQDPCGKGSASVCG